MNLHILNQSLIRNIEETYPIVNCVFDTTIQRAMTTGRAVNVRTFIKTLNYSLKPYRIKIARELTKRFGSSKDNNGQYYPAIGGYCYEPLQDKPARITIILCIHPSTNRLQLTKVSWEYFRYRFIKCLSHELVHRAQFENGRRLNRALVFKPHTIPDIPKRVVRTQTYLGDMDEVEAYAHDCVEEWYYLNPHSPLTMRKIKQQFRQKGGRLPAIQYYYETFLGDETHPSVRRLFRKIKAWDDIISPVSLVLPSAPAYVKRDAHQKRDVKLG